jgi:hypothetical protein
MTALNDFVTCPSAVSDQKKPPKLQASRQKRYLLVKWSFYRLTGRLTSNYSVRRDIELNELCNAFTSSKQH